MQEVIIKVYTDEKKPYQVRVQGDNLRVNTVGNLTNVCIQVLSSINEVTGLQRDPVTTSLAYYFFKFANQPIVNKAIDVVRDYIWNVIYK